MLVAESVTAKKKAETARAPHENRIFGDGDLWRFVAICIVWFSLSRHYEGMKPFFNDYDGG